MTADLVVIGGGSAGLAAAREGRRRGAEVVMITESPPGGECTFTGCIPSKALIAAAAQRKTFVEAMRVVHDTVAVIAGTEDEATLTGEGIEVIRGRARFRGPQELSVDGAAVRGSRFVVATGTRPAVPPVEGIESVRCLTNENIFDLDALPSSMVVLGGGPVGCELAQAFSRLGSRITLIEREDRLLASEEPEVSGTLEEVFGREGIDVRLGATVSKAERTDTGLRLQLSPGEAIDAEVLLVASGRRASTADLGLDAAGVDVDASGFVNTDDTLATGTKGIWAAGDVTGRAPFTHAADEMGRIAAGNALGRRRRHFDVRAVPFVVFTDPEVARVGCTTSELGGARGARLAVRSLTAVDRAITEGRTDGFVKMIGAKRRWLGNVGGGRLVGATVVCARAGELIDEAALAIRTQMFLGRIAQTVHAYPSWSTALRQTAAQFFGYDDGVRPA